MLNILDIKQPDFCRIINVSSVSKCIKYLAFHLENAIVVCDMHIFSLLIFPSIIGVQIMERFRNEFENSTDRNNIDDDSVGRRR